MIKDELYDVQHPDVQIALARLDKAFEMRRAAALLLTREHGNVSHLRWLADKIIEHALADADVAVIKWKQRVAQDSLVEAEGTKPAQR